MKPSVGVRISDELLFAYQMVVNVAIVGVAIPQILQSEWTALKTFLLDVDSVVFLQYGGYQEVDQQAA